MIRAMDVKAALRGHIAGSLEALQGRERVDPALVYPIRKHLKRARAGLRLLRGAVRTEAYAEENARLRRAARLLSPARDAEVTLSIVRGLLESGKLREHHAALVRLRAELRGEPREPPVEELRQALEQCAERVSHWRLPHDAWPIFSAGLERIYRRGREALAVARATPADRPLHELRKQVKYLGLAAEMLDPRPALKKLARSADAIAERLGDDHDLAVLRRRLGRADLALLARIDRRRGKLQERALKEAVRFYRRKPARFIARLESRPWTTGLSA